MRLNHVCADLIVRFECAVQHSPERHSQKEREMVEKEGEESEAGRIGYRAHRDWGACLVAYITRVLVAHRVR